MNLTRVSGYAEAQREAPRQERYLSMTHQNVYNEEGYILGTVSATFYSLTASTILVFLLDERMRAGVEIVYCTIENAEFFEELDKRFGDLNDLLEDILYQAMDAIVTPKA